MLYPLIPHLGGGDIITDVTITVNGTMLEKTSVKHNVQVTLRIIS